MHKTHLLSASVLILFAAAAACDDKKPTTETTPSATTPTATATATPSASASAAPSASATASASATPDASAAPVADAAPPKAGDGGATAATPDAPTCGKKPLPDCPLQGWMKANTSAAMATKDFDALAKALDATAGLAPPGYGNWVSISRDGAKAARDQNLDGVKASCKGCHNQYQERYKKELRLRKI